MWAYELGHVILTEYTETFMAKRKEKELDGTTLHYLAVGHPMGSINRPIMLTWLCTLLGIRG